MDLVIGTFVSEQRLARQVRSLAMNTKRGSAKNLGFLATLDAYAPCTTRVHPLEAILDIRGTPERGNVFVRFAACFAGFSAITFSCAGRPVHDDELAFYLDHHLDFDWRACCIDEEALLATRDRVASLQDQLRESEAPSIGSIAILEELLQELEAHETQRNSKLADEVRERLIRESCWLRGWTQEPPAVERARAYFESRTDTAALVAGFFQAWQQAHMLGDYRAAKVFARRLVSHASHAGASARSIVEARLAAGASAFMLGQLAEAKTHLTAAIETYDAAFEPSHELAARDGNDMGVGATTHLAWVLFLLGDEAGSHANAASALERARAIGHTTTSAMATVLAADCAHFHQEPDRVLELLDADTCHDKLPFWKELATLLRLWAMVALRRPMDDAIHKMTTALDSYRSYGALGCPYRLTQVASVCMQLGEAEAARYHLDQARAEARGTGERFWLPEILRMQAGLAQARGDVDAARSYRAEGMELATEQGSVALLARLRSEA